MVIHRLNTGIYLIITGLETTQSLLYYGRFEFISMWWKRDHMSLLWFDSIQFCWAPYHSHRPPSHSTHLDRLRYRTRCRMLILLHSRWIVRPKYTIVALCIIFVIVLTCEHSHYRDCKIILLIRTIFSVVDDDDIGENRR